MRITRPYTTVVSLSLKEIGGMEVSTEGHMTSKGLFIDGQWQKGHGESIVSVNPAKDYSPVFETASASTEQANQAVEAAFRAFPAWFSLRQEERNEAVLALKACFHEYESRIADAITSEMGKVLSESQAEAKALAARIDLVLEHALNKVQPERIPGTHGQARYHAQGVIGIISPYNFPASLTNGSLIPALLTGNTVVVKPSEVCPWVGELYAECLAKAGLPYGVVNVVQGRGDVGKAIVQHRHTRGIVFTGSYATGRVLTEMLLDQPHKMLALEMGGKNMSVILDDADLYQALIEVVQGAFLTTGQRCTATSRVLVDKKVADRWIQSFVHVVKNLRPGDPFKPETLFGPLATAQALKRYESVLQKIPSTCEALVSSQTLGGGAFVTPSVYQLKGDDAGGYLDGELFGPNVCVEIVDGLDDAIDRTNQNPYGLSNAIFTSSEASFERFYHSTYSGVVNWNRSTNGALGHLPFGGVGKSGNQRAAGIESVRYTTYPVAVNQFPYGKSEPMPVFKTILEDGRKHL